MSRSVRPVAHVRGRAYHAVMDEPVGRRRWRIVIVAVAVGLVVVVVAGLWAKDRWGNSTTPLGVDDVLADFATASTVPPTVPPTSSPSAVTSTSAESLPPVPERLAEGVYRATSSGSEGIDVLDKPTHAYPAESALVVSRTACGHRVEWVPLEERREWFEVCVEGGGIRLVRYGGFHTFYGQADERSQECPDGAWLVPPDDLAANTFTVTCTGSGMVDERTTTVLRRHTVVLDGAPVEVTVVRTTIVGSGPTRGTSTRELWFTDTGLPVVWIDDVTGVSDSVVGIVNYREQMQVRLVSLAPV